MDHNQNKKIASIALVFSIVALSTSLYTVFLGGGSFSVTDNDDKAFNARVASGIETYIENQQRQQAEGARVASQVDNNIEDDDAVEGDSKALVTMVEFSDFECPYCKRFFDDTLSQIKTNFIDNGKVKFIYRDFPLSFHKSSKSAAIAAQCAGDLGGDEAYYGFHDLVFQNQQSLTEESFKQHAASLGLNASGFSECLVSGKFDAEIDKDIQDGQKAGVTGTPGSLILMKKTEKGAETLKEMELIQQGQFIIQYIETEDGKRMGVRISGAHPFSTFEKAIQVGL